MRKFILLAIVTIVGALLLWGPQVAHEQQIPSPDKHQESNASANPVSPARTTVHPLAIAPGATPETNHSKNETPEKPLPRFERPEWVIVYITGIYVFIAGLTLWAIKKQADIMEVGAKDARDSATASAASAQATLNAIERQVANMRRQVIWLRFSARAAKLSAGAAVTNSKAAAIQIQMMKDKERAKIQVTPADFEAVDLDENKNNHMTIEFLNLGPTHAFNVRAEGDGWFTVKDFDPEEIELTDLVLPTVLRPNIPETTWVPLVFDGKAGDEVRYMQAKTMIHMMGSVEYDDVFGERHKTAFHYQMFVYGWEKDRVPNKTVKMKRMGGWRKSGPPEDNHAS